MILVNMRHTSVNNNKDHRLGSIQDLLVSIQDLIGSIQDLLGSIQDLLGSIQDLRGNLGQLFRLLLTLMTSIYDDVFLNPNTG